MQIVIGGTDDGTEVRRLDLDAELPEEGEALIDQVDQNVQTLCNQAARGVVGHSLERLLEKHARAECAARGGELTLNDTPYRIDAECGRLSFRTYAVRVGQGIVWNTVGDMLPPLGPREYYRTAGLNYQLTTLASSLSYREASGFLNHIRRETTNPTPARTVEDIIQREGTALQLQLRDWATQELTAHNFTPEGQPRSIEEPDGQRAADPAELGLPPACVQQAIEAYNAGKPEASRLPAEAAAAFYEDPQRTVSVSLDDVGVRKQKEERARPAATTGARATPPHDSGQQPAGGVSAAPSPGARAGSPHTPAADTESDCAKSADRPERDAAQAPKPPRPSVHNTIAHVQSSRGSYIINGLGTAMVLNVVLAFLLHWDMLSGSYLQFFVDGQRTLQAAILGRLAWLHPLRLILDWYHLREKCAKELSTALRGRHIRNAALGCLLPLLWLGRVDAAIAYLRGLGTDCFKASQSAEALIGYFERNRAHIPCYALRKQLGLRNSSNRGEKANDLCVAGRQKHQGMSWSTTGSVALASIVTLRQNEQLKCWCTDHQQRFDWVA